RTLIGHKAEMKKAGFLAVTAALCANSPACVDQLIQAADPKVMSEALLFLLPPRGSPVAFGNADLVKKAIAHGADVNARDPAGRTVLMLAAGSEYFSIDTIGLIIDRGADVNAKSAGGETAPGFAKPRGAPQPVG